MNKGQSHNIAYWFLKTGNLQQAIYKVKGRTFIPQVTDTLLESKAFKKSLDYWLPHFKEIGMEFNLEGAAQTAHDIVEDIKKRMFTCEDTDEYLKLSTQCLNILTLFGGNWSGFNRESQVSVSQSFSFNSEPRQLKPAKQYEVEDAQVQDITEDDTQTGTEEEN